VSDQQLETLPWNDLCNRIVESRNQQTPHTSSLGLPPLDAHIVANRILRKDNFMIALLNKEVLDLSVPKINYGPIMTTLMEWNLNYCIFSWVFDEKGAFRRRFLKDKNKHRLVSQYISVNLRLKKRFQTMAIINLALSPFVLVFLIMFSFFKFSEVCTTKVRNIKRIRLQSETGSIHLLPRGLSGSLMSFRIC
jgi:Autophagy protein ATG9